MKFIKNVFKPWFMPNNLRILLFGTILVDTFFSKYSESFLVCSWMRRNLSNNTFVWFATATFLFSLAAFYYFLKDITTDKVTTINKSLFISKFHTYYSLFYSKLKTANVKFYIPLKIAFNTIPFLKKLKWTPLIKKNGYFEQYVNINK